MSEKGKETAAAAVDTGSKVEYLLCTMDMCFSTSAEILSNPNVWIAATAVTVHSMPHSEGLKNPKEATINDLVTMGNGEDIGALMIAQLPGKICDKYGNELKTAVLNDVTHLLQAKYNLFSLSKMVRNEGWRLGGDKEAIWIEKDGQQLCFDIVIPTPKGALYCMYYKRTTEMAMAVTDKGTKLNIMKAHDLLGHCSEEMTRSAAKSMGWILTSSWKPCESCTVAKARQKNVPKETQHTKADVGENQIFLDIATVKRQKDSPPVSNPNWRIMVNERTGMKFSDFYASKTAMVEPTCEQWHKWKTVGLVVKYCRLDNAGENKLLQKRCNSAEWQLGIEFEFTARDTPQQNHLAELGFAVLANRGRALMTRANVPVHYQFKLFREAFKTATLLDALLIVKIDREEKSRVEHWSGNKPEYALIYAHGVKQELLS